MIDICSAKYFQYIYVQYNNLSADALVSALACLQSISVDFICASSLNLDRKTKS